MDSNTRQGEECVEVDFITIYFTLMPKLSHLTLLPAVCLLTHFFFLRNVSKVYDVDQFEQVVSKMLLIMNLLLLSIDWLMVAKTAMFV